MRGSVVLSLWGLKGFAIHSVLLVWMFASSLLTLLMVWPGSWVATLPGHLLNCVSAVASLLCRRTPWGSLFVVSAVLATFTSSTLQVATAAPWRWSSDRIKALAAVSVLQLAHSGLAFFPFRSQGSGRSSISRWWTQFLLLQRFHPPLFPWKLILQVWRTKTPAILKRENFSPKSLKLQRLRLRGVLLWHSSSRR